MISVCAGIQHSLNEVRRVSKVITDAVEMVLCQDRLPFFGEDVVIEEPTVSLVGTASYQPHGTVDRHRIPLRKAEGDRLPGFFHVADDIVHADPHGVRPVCDLQMGGGGVALKHTAVFPQTLKIRRSVGRGIHQRADEVFDAAGAARVRHHDLPVPSGIQQIVPGPGRVLLGDQIRVVGDDRRHQPSADVVMVLIHEGLVDIDGLRRDVGGEIPVFLQLSVIRRSAGPDQIGGDLSGLHFRGQLGQDLVGPCEEVVHGDLGVLCLKALLDSLNFLLLHGTVQCNGSGVPGHGRRGLSRPWAAGASGGTAHQYQAGRDPFEDPVCVHAEVPPSNRCQCDYLT